ncbi:Protein kinase STUNTED [Linum perenne]
MIVVVTDGSILAKHSSSRKTVAVNSLDRVLSLSLKDGKEPGKSCLAHKVHSSRALIPFQGSDSKLTTSHSNVSGELPDHKLGWKLVRQKLTGKQDCSKRFHASKAVRKFLKLPTHNSSSVVGLPEELNGLYEKYSSMCRWFSYEELEAATSNFAPENIIGTGGSSHVYKGLLPSGKELAVKILKPSDDVLKEFVVEIEMITTLHHKNIISLFGFCFDHSKLLLVYDFLSRGSLEENLHGNKKDVVTFGWHERHKVAVGVAEALDYLHNHCDHPVIHRDVKSSNVLLFDDFEPQLSDFGLACWMCSSTEETNSDVAGTFGYLAPEYFMHGRMSDKLDVFAFGVVLLELLSGRMAIAGPDSQGQESLLMWARPILQGGKQSQLLDPHIKTEDAEDEIERMVMAATLCIRSCPKSRPQISVILKLLQGDSEITKWGKVEMAESEVGNGSEGRRDPSNIQSHLNIALLDVQQDDSVSISEHVEVTVEDYLQGRWSRTASFD